MKYFIITFLAIIAAIYIFLVLAVNDDSRRFHEAWSSIEKTKSKALKFDSLQYSVYRWRTNRQSGEWELFLAYYIKIDKNGNYIAMRHNTTPEPALCFKGKIDSSVRHFLDSLAIVHLDSFYIKPGLRTYDGNTFRLTYSGSIKNNIEYYQVDAPPFLRKVSTVLDTVIFNSRQQVPSFNLSSIEQELKKQSHAYLQGLPKKAQSPQLPHINTKKYKPVPNKT